MPRRLTAALACLALTLGACRSAQVVPPAVPAGSLVETGRASFFFPVQIPLSQVRKALEDNIPRQLRGEQKEELSAGLEDDSYRYDVERGEVVVGFHGGRITFGFTVRGNVTLSGRLRAVPVPVRETIELRGSVIGSARPALTPDWQADPDPTAQLRLDRADIKVFGVPVSLRGLLEEKINPVLDRELEKAGGQLLSGLALGNQAREAWESLHFARRALDGENLWIRFRPDDVAVSRVTEKDGVLRSGIGISGEVSMVLGRVLEPPAVTPLPPPEIVDGGDGRFELEVPLQASPAELTALADRSLRGFRYRRGSQEIVARSAAVSAEGDRLLLTLDFEATRGKRKSPGQLILQGRPVFDARTSLLTFSDLKVRLAAKDLRLRLANRFHKDDLLKAVAKRARLDLGPILGDAEREARAAILGLLPREIRGEVRLEPVTILSVGVSGGVVVARCRVAGRTGTLEVSGVTRP
jgi:hypothetical protein